MLERAWERWRSAHGLAAEPLPPVSSYVGYSIEEPWGRPRVVFGVAAEEAERLAAFLQDSLDRGDEADDNGGQWPPSRSGGPAGPPGAERGDRLEDVRGRIPVQSWPEFSESREALNSSGAAAPGRADAPYPDNADGPDDAERPDGGRGDGGAASRADDRTGTAGPGQEDLRYDDDDAGHAAWLSGIRASGDADDGDDEYCDTADDLRAMPHGARPAQAAPPAADATDRTSHNGTSGGHDTGTGATGPDEAPAPGASPADTGVIGWPSSAGLAHPPRPPASPPHHDGPPGNGHPADGEPMPGPFPGRADESPSGGPQPGGPDNTTSGGPGRPGDGAVDRPQDGPAAAGAPAELASRTSLTDSMAAELAGWAAGELPGQASARLAAWASVGGAVARGRQRAARGGGSTAAERVR